MPPRPLEFQIGPTGRTLALNVRRLRQSRGLSQAQLGARVSQALSYSLYQNWVQKFEWGERRCDVDQLAALAQALGVSVPVLMSRQAVDQLLLVRRKTA